MVSEGGRDIFGKTEEKSQADCREKLKPASLSLGPIDCCSSSRQSVSARHPLVRANHGRQRNLSLFSFAFVRDRPSPVDFKRGRRRPSSLCKSDSVELKTREEKGRDMTREGEREGRVSRSSLSLSSASVAFLLLLLLFLLCSEHSSTSGHGVLVGRCQWNKYGYRM